jgi:hypothetical protein
LSSNFSHILNYNKEWFSRIFQKQIPIVNEKECQQRIYKIIQNASAVNPYSFYMITNVFSKSITWTHRMQELLGYPDVSEKRPIDLNQYFAWIHQDHLELYLLFGIAMYRTVYENPQVVNRSDYQFYGIELPLYSNKLKKYIYVYQRSLPLHLGPNNELITHLNIYNLGKEYEGEKKINFPAVTIGILQDNIFWNKLLLEIRTRVFDFYHLTFSEIQTNILKSYINFPDESLREHAKKLGYSYDRLKNANRYIKQKLELISGIKYKSISEALETHHFLKHLF